MGQFVKGQVVVLPFPFSDLSATKRRPALVVASLPGDDVILCQITSVFHSDRYAVAVSDEDFVAGSLARLSYVRTDRLFTADSALIIRIAGQLSQPKLDEVTAKLIQLFVQP